MLTPETDTTKGTLVVRDETHTIGNLLSRSVYELMPDISFAGYTCIPHEKVMRLTVIHPVADPSELTDIVLRATQHAYGVFNQIHRDIRALL